MRERRTRPEGWRTLKVGELVLWWTTSPPWSAPAPDQLGCLVVRVTVTIERADGSGKRLVATLHGRRALALSVAGLAEAPTIAIEAAAVKRLVETAAPRGAWPTGTGAWRTAVELPARPLPRELALLPEHLTAAAVVWQRA